MLTKSPGATEPRLDSASSRRAVLKWTGGALAFGAIFGGQLPNFGISPALAADLGKGDVGVLNYAYALEQLEAAFYTMVVDKPFRGITDEETQVLTDLRDHEVDHREFLKNALADNAIPSLEVDFSKVDFSDRTSVLETARTFEDLGVGAYNGAGKLLENPDYLAAAGRIVSIEARHAAAIRDLIQPGSVAFAAPGVADKNGLDVALPMSKVLAAASPFITTDVTAKSF